MASGKAAAEIEVFGGGIFGLTVAYTLQMRGAQVRLIEKRHIGAGASGGVVGALAPHTPDNWNNKKQFQYESLIASPDFWAEVDHQSGQKSGYLRTGRLVAIEDARVLGLAYERIEGATKFWQNNAQWHVLKSGSYPNWEPESPTGFLTYDTLSARINPAQACRSLAAAFQAIGGELLVNTSIGKGADATIICTGYEGLVELSGEIDQAVGRGAKGQGILLEYDAPDAPQIFTNGMHIVPHSNGTLAVGSTTENDWENPDQTDDRLDDLHANAIAACPFLKDARILQRWAGVRPRTARRTPILGQYPGRKNTFIANGGFKIGFGVAVKVGEVMADLVLNGSADYPESFSVEANLK